MPTFLSWRCPPRIPVQGILGRPPHTFAEWAVRKVEAFS
jgi:hypothetical protein